MTFRAPIRDIAFALAAVGGARYRATFDRLAKDDVKTTIEADGLRYRKWGHEQVAKPGDWLVESKSLKLFLGAFRNHNGFHEDVTVGIGQRLFAEMKPQWLRIGGYWYPRGGMPIDVFWQSGAPPEGLWLPDQGVAPYRGRG